MALVRPASWPPRKKKHPGLARVKNEKSSAERRRNERSGHVCVCVAMLEHRGSQPSSGAARTRGSRVRTGGEHREVLGRDLIGTKDARASTHNIVGLGLGVDEHRIGVPHVKAARDTEALAGGVHCRWYRRLVVASDKWRGSSDRCPSQGFVPISSRRCVMVEADAAEKSRDEPLMRHESGMTLFTVPEWMAVTTTTALSYTHASRAVSHTGQFCIARVRERLPWREYCGQGSC